MDDTESLKLLGFALKNRSVFEAIERSKIDPSGSNLMAVQREIYFLVQRERSDARDPLITAALIGLPVLIGAGHYLFC